MIHTRSSNVLARALFESPFVQKKHAFTTVLEMSPAGVVGVDADTDAMALNRRLTAHTLKNYGKMLRLFAEIDECVVVLDAGRWPWYLHAGGIASCNLYKGPADYLDLTVGPKERGVLTMNPSVKAVVVNHVWGAMLELLAMIYPIYVANPEVAEGLPRMITQVAHIHDDLEETIQAACMAAGTDKVLVFDGSYGHINLSPSLGRYLLDLAPAVSRKVDEHYLPLWLSQRGLSEDDI